MKVAIPSVVCEMGQVVAEPAVSACVVRVGEAELYLLDTWAGFLLFMCSMTIKLNQMKSRLSGHFCSFKMAMS